MDKSRRRGDACEEEEEEEVEEGRSCSPRIHMHQRYHALLRLRFCLKQYGFYTAQHGPRDAGNPDARRFPHAGRFSATAPLVPSRMHGTTQRNRTVHIPETQITGFQSEDYEESASRLCKTQYDLASIGGPFSGRGVGRWFGKL